MVTPAKTMSARPTLGFSLLYSLIWLPYAALYVAIFALSQGMSFGWALVSAIVNVIPAALLGLGILALPRRVPLRRRVGPTFLLTHAMLAALFTSAWFALVMVGLMAVKAVQTGVWSLVFFRGPALHWQLLQGLLLYAVMTSIAYAAVAFRALQEQEARAARAELTASRAEAMRSAAELKALRAQLNPHFLFNTLHTLQALVRRDPQRGEDAVERLGGLLRYSLRDRPGEGSDDDVRLGEEWDFVRDYLALEELRLGSRLQVTADLEPESLRCTIPALTLQPLVENAIKHAIAPRSRGGTVRIQSRVKDNQLWLEVRDDGPGAAVPLTREGDDPGLGLRLVRERLLARFGSAALVSIDTAPGAGFAVSIRVPARSREAAPS